MQLTWTRGEIVGGGKLTVYVSVPLAYRIEKWAEGTWAVMLLGTTPNLPRLAFTRHSLTAAKLGVQEELDGVPTDQRKRY